MNNSKIWLVVNPTVGVPLFLSAVAVGSFAVHVAVLTNTPWVGNFLSGKAVMETASVETSPLIQKTDGANAVVVFDGATTISSVGKQEGTVVLPDGRTARVVFDGAQTNTGQLALAN